MLREKNMAFMALALIFALLAAFGVYYYINDYEENILKRSGLTTTVVAAAYNLKPGTMLTEEMLTSMEWPKSKVLSSHFKAKKDVIGKAAKTSIPAGLPILKDLLADKGDNLSYFVPSKMRAMAIHFGRDGSGVAFVYPGSFVDVLATFKKKGEDPYTKTILQGVKVIAVNGRAEDNFKKNENEQIQNITILIKPEDTVRLALAKNQASLQIVLRNLNDKDRIENKGISTEQVKYGKKELPKVNVSEKARQVQEFINKVQPPSSPVTLIRGTEINKLKFKEER